MPFDSRRPTTDAPIAAAAAERVQRRRAGCGPVRREEVVRGVLVAGDGPAVGFCPERDDEGIAREDPGRRLDPSGDRVDRVDLGPDAVDARREELAEWPLDLVAPAAADPQP